MATADKNKLAEEITRLEALLEEQPGSPDFYLLADLYTRSGRLLEAIKICRDGLRQHPRLAAGHVALGRALFGSGNLPVAAKVLRRSLLLEDAGAESYRLFGEVLLRLSRPAEALKVLKRARDRGITDRPVLTLLNRARGALKRQKYAQRQADAGRGVGNLVVSGTIDTDSEETHPVPTVGADELDGGAVVDRAPGLRPGGAPRVKTDLSLRRLPLEIFRVDDEQQQSWSSIDEEWERQLDASQVRLLSRPAIKTPTPGFEPVELSVTPLTDPLSDGMPPLPLDDEESTGEVTTEEPSLDLVEEVIPTIPEELTPLVTQKARVTAHLERPRQTGPLPRLEDADAVEDDHSMDQTMPREVAAQQPDAEMDRTLAREAVPPPAAPADAGVPAQSDIAAAAAGLEAGEPLEDTGPYQLGLDQAEESEDLDVDSEDHADTEDAPTIRFVRVPEDELFIEEATPPEISTTTVTTAAPARSNRLLLLLVVLGVLLLFGAGAFLGWLIYQRHTLVQAPRLEFMIRNHSVSSAADLSDVSRQRATGFRLRGDQRCRGS